MQEYDFIPADVYDDLPEEAAEQFLVLTAAAEQTFRKRLENAPDSDADILRRAFIAQLSAVADELNIGSLVIPPASSFTSNDWSQFQASLTSLRTRIKLRSQRNMTRDAVLLSKVTKARIEREIVSLRQMIDISDISQDLKKKLNERLDELAHELTKKRMSFGKLATTLAAVAGILGGSSTALANGPRALDTVGKIMSWVGADKEAEEVEQLRLSAPLKALPAPSGNDTSTN